MKVGFIGLGIMGRPMCINLLKAGYQVTAYDFHQEKVDSVVAEGAFEAKNASDVASKSEVVITMLQNSPNVEEAIFGENGLIESMPSGGAIIDMSSINPVASQSFASRLKQKKIDFLDAPVSGGEIGAISGTIAVMVGGDEQVFNKYYNLLKAMSGSVVRCGEVGAGNTTKLANQMIVALNIAAMSEAFTLAKKAGVDPQKVFEAIKGGLAGSAVMNQKGPMILSQNYQPGFRIELHIKDLQNALDVAHTINCSVPFTASMMEILQFLKINGYEKLDHSSIIKYFEEMNKTAL